MESFLRRALHFFNHDRLDWFVYATRFCIYSYVLPIPAIIGVWTPFLLFGVFYREVPLFFSNQLAGSAVLGLLLIGYIFLTVSSFMLTYWILYRLHEPTTNLLYRLLTPYRWVMLHLLLSWMHLWMFFAFRCRPFVWSIRDLRFAPSRYRASRYRAGYVDPYPVFARLTPTVVIAICGLPLPTMVVWHAYGPLEATLWASAICLVVATDLLDIHHRLNDRRDPLYL